jgi:hypothetical protein
MNSGALYSAWAKRNTTIALIGGGRPDADQQHQRAERDERRVGQQPLAVALHQRQRRRGQRPWRRPRA